MFQAKLKISHLSEKNAYSGNARHWNIEVFNQEGCQETYDAVCMISRVNATALSKDYANLLSLRSLSHSLLADHPLD